HYEVANLTDNTIDVTQEMSLPNAASGNDSWNRTLVFDGVAGKSYQPRVVINTLSVGTLKVTVSSIMVLLLPTVTQNQKVRSDPGSLPTRSDVEKLDSSANMMVPLSATAVPFWLPPGLSLIYLNEFDAPNYGYLEN